MIKYRDLVNLVRLSNSLKELEEATESTLNEGTLWTFAKDNWELFRSTIFLSGTNIKTFVNCMSLIINEVERVKSICNKSTDSSLISKIKESSEEDALKALEEYRTQLENNRNKCNDIMINYFYEERYNKNIIIANVEQFTPKEIAMDLRKIKYKKPKITKDISAFNFESLLKAMQGGNSGNSGNSSNISNNLCHMLSKHLMPNTL